MPCTRFSALTSPITGTVSLYYAAPGETFSNVTTIRTAVNTSSYLGNIEAGSLNIRPSVTSDEVFGDVLGPDTPTDVVLGPGPDQIDFTLIDVNRAAVKKLIYPYGQNIDRTQLTPGFSSRKPFPGALESTFRGRLRMAPASGNVGFWLDDDLDMLVDRGGNIRDYYQVILDNDEEVLENYNSKLLRLPVRLIARPCFDDTLNAYATHQYVTSLTAPLT